MNNSNLKGLVSGPPPSPENEPPNIEDVGWNQHMVRAMPESFSCLFLHDGANTFVTDIQMDMEVDYWLTLQPSGFAYNQAFGLWKYWKAVVVEVGWCCWTCRVSVRIDTCPRQTGTMRPKTTRYCTTYCFWPFASASLIETWANPVKSPCPKFRCKQSNIGDRLEESDFFLAVSRPLSI